MQGRYDRFLDTKKFIYAKASAEKDRFKDIYLRSVLGLGYGYQVLEDDATHLALRFGADRVKVRRIVAAGELYTALGWGIDFRHRWLKRGIEVFHNQEGTRGVGAHANTVLLMRTGVSLSLAAHLNGSAQINVDWESRPAADRKRSDITLLFGLGYAFD